MGNNIEAIGVDVGNGLTKTVHTEFISSVRDYGETKPALKDRLVCYGGKNYVVGGTRTKTKTDQKKDETSFILALAGIGEELNIRGISDAHVVLSEGLPLERCIKENQIKDETYYKKGETISFEYENVPHTIVIDDVLVNPQCVSGIIDLLAEGSLPDPCIVIDVGSWTLDILPIEGGRPQGAKVKSALEGIINCMIRCNDEIRRRTGGEVMETQIQKIMMGDDTALPPEYTNIVISEIKKYIHNIADTLIENKYNINTLTCIFMGGGASVIKNYGMEIFPYSKYITNIRANAIGYEKIANQHIRELGNQ